MLLTFEQSLDIARKRYQTMLAEASEERKARQARVASTRRTMRLAERALTWLGARFHDPRRVEPARVAGA
ncbi:hypothetical protein [Roseiflexus sp.]|uniref:hypothetical protein n=1 Tax=Roseiflexus sp. TaxID=2562120 RepID=UPI0021DC68B4|nr:hypothetical protein [Roseiflexus sp.]GIW02491.1 MAG: hypothetical protein KatS3mg058_3894 [Roseiflexus sp.]